MQTLKLTLEKLKRAIIKIEVLSLC